MTVLADTSVWIAHFRKHDVGLALLLESSSVLMHPFVLGEIACANLRNRATVLEYMRVLPQALSAAHGEALALLDNKSLWGCGIGWIDAHLLASCLLTHCTLWALDGKLNAAAAEAGVGLFRSA